MKSLAAFVPLCLLLAVGCSPSEKTATSDGSSATVPETMESLYARGHALYADGRHDSAAYYLERARAIDRGFLPPLEDLGEIYYLAGMNSDVTTPERERNMKAAVACYATMDSLGQADEADYERLAELSHGLGDKKLFLVYAEKQVKLFPGDRELYNLGLGYFGVGNFQKVIETQKGAIEKYPHSPYIAGFYRLLGDGYLSVDRQQSAERTYEEGLRVTDEGVRGMKEADPAFTGSAVYRQLADNYLSMVSSLKKIYRLHGKQEKLKQLESRPDFDP
jgi:tetratricopeptide (TPR) repeat protein